MSGALFIQNRQRTVPVDVRSLRRLARALLREIVRLETFELGISLVAPPEMISLNQSFLGHSGSTDVITFDYRERSGAVRPRPADFDRTKAAHPALHGEIILCPEEAVSQARRFRTTWQRELARYLIHGVLHLMGYDDRRAADRRRMKREEDRLLRQLSRRCPLARLAAR